MPLVRISLKEGRSAEDRRAIADCVHTALVEAIGIPVDDRFQVVTEYSSDGLGNELFYDAHYLGIERSGRGETGVLPATRRPAHRASESASRRCAHHAERKRFRGLVIREWCCAVCEVSQAAGIQQEIPAFFKSSFNPCMLVRLEASGVPAPRQCVSRLTAYW